MLLDRVHVQTILLYGYVEWEYSLLPMNGSVLVKHTNRFSVYYRNMMIAILWGKK